MENPAFLPLVSCSCRLLLPSAPAVCLLALVTGCFRAPHVGDFPLGSISQPKISIVS
jgi:hypothetical protein